jgi:hypothetical protein
LPNLEGQAIGAILYLLRRGDAAYEKNEKKLREV